MSDKEHKPLPMKATSSARCTLFERVEDSIKKMTGEILTLVDASFSDPEQRKAFKDCIKNRIKSFHQDNLNRDIYEVFCLLAPVVGDEPTKHGFPPSWKGDDLKYKVDYNYSRTKK